MTHLLIIGGGPAGTQAATVAAAKGARVTLVEKDIVGGAAHLLDCIPSKTMAAAALGGSLLASDLVQHLPEAHKLLLR